MEDVRIREAAPDDADELAVTYRDAYRENRELGFPAKAGSTSGEEVREWIERFRVLVAETDGTVVGGVRLEPVDEGTVKLSRLGVREGWKGMGVGSHLLERAEASARARGAETIRLTTPESHPYLVEFYRSRGYQVTGEYALDHREYDEVVMEKTLG